MIVRKAEKGFAMVLSLVLLLAMSLMGGALILISSGDHQSNNNSDQYQQTFYAAETGITEAKKWLSNQTNLSIGSDPNNQLSFCKTAFFPELSNPKAVKDYIEKNSLDVEIIEQAEIQIKYRGYIEKEKNNADKLQRLEDIKIPKHFDYDSLASLSFEAKEKLNSIRPSTLSQASRISGINPSDISVLLVKMGR